jgi:hypothetical protein
VSNTFIVLVFNELESFVRKILQREENKEVELTVWREKKLEGKNKRRIEEVNSRQLKVESKGS